MFGIIYKRKTGMFVEVVKRPLVFIIYTSAPLDSLRRVAIIFDERKVIVERMQVNRFRSGEAMIIIHSLAESEKMDELEKSLKAIPGVNMAERVLS